MGDAPVMDKLYAHLHFWAATAHEWSYCDCFMVLADWVRVVRGFDPGEELRGTYGDPAVCPIARSYRADPISLGDRLLARLPVVDEARVGDIAFVQMPGDRFLCGAIRLKSGPHGRAQWAMKVASRGVLVTHRAQPVKVWGVGYEA